MALMTLSAFLLLCPCAGAVAAADVRTAVVLYPEQADGRPANELSDQSIRTAFAAGAPERIQTLNDSLVLSRFQRAPGRKALADFLRKKYAGQTIHRIDSLHG